MEELKSWAFSVCAAVVCGAVLNMLVPESNLQKTFKCVICVFILCVLVSPLSKIKFPDIKDMNNEYYAGESELSENEFSELSAGLIEEKILNDTSELLKDEKINFDDISVKINISENGSIDINKFTLTLKNSDGLNSVKEKVEQKIGIEPEIVVSGESENGNAQ